MLLLLLAMTAAALFAGYRAAAPAGAPLSRYVPAGPLLYIEAKDFGALLAEWNTSPQKRLWTGSGNYEVFSRSRLFLRLKGASDQFATAAGFPPDMNFLSQVAGDRSALAIYDIGNLQFLYVTHLSSAKSAQTILWQTRSKFEPRSAGGTAFYIRRDPESHREVAFAISGEYLLLATREDLMAGALQLIAGSGDRSVEGEPWWAASVSSAGEAGDLRMVLNLEKIVPSPYFRTYWVQQNITDLKQYSAAVVDLFRTGTQYREERVLVRKSGAPPGGGPPDAEANAASSGTQAAADLLRLVPSDAGLYQATANPSADACVELLAGKLLAPHIGPVPASQIAPQVQLGSGETGMSTDLETRIDLPAVQRAVAPSATAAVQRLLGPGPILASLAVQGTSRDRAGVFVGMHTAIVLVGNADWNEAIVESALLEALRPELTAGELGVGWQERSGYRELDGLFPLAIAVRGKHLLVTDDVPLLQSLLSNFEHKPDQGPVAFAGGFRHARERENFARLSAVIDRPYGAETPGVPHEPQFFADNVASLSSALRGVAAEEILVRPEGDKVRQTVTYEWSE
jgi:hypothetical protein